MSSEKVEPVSTPVAAAQTVANLRSHLIERSSQTPAEVTDSGTNRQREGAASFPNICAYFLAFLSYPSSAATAGDPALREARKRAAENGFTTVTSRRVRPSPRSNETSPGLSRDDWSEGPLVSLSTWNARGSALSAKEAMVLASASCLRSLAPAAALQPRRCKPSGSSFAAGDAFVVSRGGRQSEA